MTSKAAMRALKVAIAADVAAERRLMIRATRDGDRALDAACGPHHPCAMQDKTPRPPMHPPTTMPPRHHPKAHEPMKPAPRRDGAAHQPMQPVKRGGGGGTGY